MTNRYPGWVYLVVIGVLALCGLMALPNLYGESAAVQVTRERGESVPEDIGTRLAEILDGQDISWSNMYADGDSFMVTFEDDDSRRLGRDALRDAFESLPASDYLFANNFASRSPAWLRALGMRPVNQGLDLRGGVHLLYEVDMDSALEQAREGYVDSFKSLARQNNVPRIVVSLDGVTIRVSSREGQQGLDEMERLIRDQGDDFVLERQTGADGQPRLAVRLSDNMIKERQAFAIEQNTETMRSRLDQLGVAEPLVQQQGQNRIVVQLPGVDDPSEIARVLGAVATLEFRGECDEGSPMESLRTGVAPPGCQLFTERDTGAPVLLKRSLIAAGGNLTSAQYQPNTQDGPAVAVRLDSDGARTMLDYTKEYLKRRMAVVFIETNSIVDPETNVRQTEKTSEVISLATIQGVFGSRFQITGLKTYEAQQLAVLLRAGALAAPIYVVEERTVGPSLGKDNIERGKKAIAIGFLMVVVFMLVYYKIFGLFANFALFANVVIMLGLLSLLQAALTLPGIAGIVLTVGMAVDANVLIFERIREELRNGISPQAAIHAGYNKAFSSIADANVTTFIAAIVLWLFGTGPVRGFAVTLSIGILSSMFTAIVGTRALVNWLYGGRKLDKLPV